MSGIVLDVCLYGELTRYGRESNPGSCSNLKVNLPENSTVKDLLDYLLMCTSERGVTFINGRLTAWSELQPDLDQPLQDRDRLVFLPPQYIMTGKASDAIRATETMALLEVSS